MFGLRDGQYPMMTASGLIIYPLSPSPEEIDIDDIAHALGNTCRYTGHCSAFYSVAEHSVRVANLIYKTFDDRYGAWDGLMHDAAEAYIGDVARPVKYSKGVGTAYKKVEDRLMRVIADKFEFSYPKPDYVEWADKVLLRTEQRDLMPASDVWVMEGEVLPKKIVPWSPKRAKEQFLDRYMDYAP